MADDHWMQIRKKKAEVGMASSEDGDPLPSSLSENEASAGKPGDRLLGSQWNWEKSNLIWRPRKVRGLSQAYS